MVLVLATTSALVVLSLVTGRPTPLAQDPGAQRGSEAAEPVDAEPVDAALEQSHRTVVDGGLVDSAVVVRVQETDSTRLATRFDAALWERRLADLDLRARETAFDQLARRAPDWPQARQWLTEQASTPRGELAWTCRLLLRETERRALLRTSARGAETLEFGRLLPDRSKSDESARLMPRALDERRSGSVVSFDITGSGERIVVRSFESVLEELSELDRRTRPVPTWTASPALRDGAIATGTSEDVGARSARDRELRLLIDALVPAPSRVRRSEYTIEYLVPTDPTLLVEMAGIDTESSRGAFPPADTGTAFDADGGRRGMITLRFVAQDGTDRGPIEERLARGRIERLAGGAQLPNDAGTRNGADARTRHLLTGVVLPLVHGRVADGTVVEGVSSRSVSVRFDRLGVLVVEESGAATSADDQNLGSGANDPEAEGTTDAGSKDEHTGVPSIELVIEPVIESRRGLLILDVEPDSLAQVLGLRGGDRLIAIDGVVLEQPDQISERLRRGAHAGRIAVRWWRAADGEIVERGFLAARPLDVRPREGRVVEAPIGAEKALPDPEGTPATPGEDGDQGAGSDAAVPVPDPVERADG